MTQKNVNGYFIEKDDAGGLCGKMKQMVFSKDMVENIRSSRQEYIEK